MSFVSTIRMMLAEAAAEFLKAWRLPSFMLPSFLFPTGFYVLFGLVVPSATGSRAAALYYLATYGVFAAMGPSLFGFGIGIASERVEGWLELKRLSPAPMWVMFWGKLVMAATFVIVVLIILYVLAASAGDVRLSRAGWFRLAAAHLVTVPPMALLGMTAGLLFRPQAAAGIINIVMLAMAAMGGLFLPVSILPDPIQRLVFWLPTYHLAQLSLWSAGMAEDARPAVHLTAVAIFTAVFLIAAAFAWRRAAGSR